MAKQPIKPRQKKSKSFIEDMTEKIGSGVSAARNFINSSPPIGSTGRYTVAPVSVKKKTR